MSYAVGVSFVPVSEIGGSTKVIVDIRALPGGVGDTDDVVASQGPEG